MYQALYRKYRPKNFVDVYGQDHIVSTLKNEICENRVSHAYLFTGSRGTGKTTCSKLLAKAVNCENNIDGEPCNECEVCRGIDNGSIFDVVEIDAASNNGVDNIRDLREEANYTPARSKYRVYIIDEVHMLSQGAFNALLKTLEEPPAHVIFILATTEVHKIPATILSRCQRFDFKRIQPETMAVRLKQVAEAEGMTIDDPASILIARLADGALRDGLSILDQCSSRSKNIDSELVSQVAGIAGREILHKLTSCVQTKNSSEAMELLSELYQNSYDMERLCVDMISHFRNLLIVKTVKKFRELIICTDDEFNSISSSANDFTLENIIFALDLFQNTLTKIKSGANSRIEMEMTFIILCQPKLDSSQNAILERISQLELAVKRGVSVKTQQTASYAPEPTVEKAVADINTDSKTENSEDEQVHKINLTETYQEPVLDESKTPAAENHYEPKTQETIHSAQTADADENTQPQTVKFEHWDEFMEAIHKNDIALFGILNSSKAYVRGEFFLIDSPNPTVKNFIKIPTHTKAIKKSLFEVTGINYKLGIFKNTSGEAQKRDLLEDLVSKAQGNVKINFE
ncbi:MAG: DNA polymerase III subunit gamma/tau [Acetobacter sp.]|nr:DNA polymerase III subunit gamma/tau [Bacteroides sp.]MCM1341741.1 DNA polymerase III subunit gamma/tau [Acetobacter sp.]MCM1432320.1 DNA polymerase III subunit gamma/tau [Clostridiales bacterium]